MSGKKHNRYSQTRNLQTCGFVVFGFVVLLLLSSCSSSIRFSSAKQPFKYSTPKATTPPQQQDYSHECTTPRQQQLLAEAERWLGTPYCFGGTAESCVDCSGFMINVYSSVGLTLPRTSKEMFAKGKSVSVNNLECGDLVFFDFERDGTVGHVGMYIGNDLFIHSSTTQGVIVQPLQNEFYLKYVVGYRRY